MSDRLPKRYRFDNPKPEVYRPEPLPEQHPHGQPVIHQHFHEAPKPDRTVQRLALGAGMGGGAVAAGVYYGPLLVGVLTAMVGFLLAMAIMFAVVGWVIVHVVRSVSGAGSKRRK